MKHIPIIPTVLVAAAVATMIGLGIWQIRRADWKEGLIARFEANAKLPPADMPNNHILYAWQWFFFAAAALTIYALALRKRLREGKGVDAGATAS